MRDYSFESIYLKRENNPEILRMNLEENWVLPVKPFQNGKMEVLSRRCR